MITYGGCSQEEAFSDVIFLNLEDNTWNHATITGDALLGKYWHSSCLFQENNIVIFGGCDTSDIILNETAIIKITNIERILFYYI